MITEIPEAMAVLDVPPTHWMDDMGRVCTDSFMRSDKAHGDYQIAYNIPCVKRGRKIVPINALATVEKLK